MVYLDRQELYLPSNIWSQKYIVILLYGFPSLLIAAAKFCLPKTFYFIIGGYFARVQSKGLAQSEEIEGRNACLWRAISNYYVYIPVKTFKVFVFIVNLLNHLIVSFSFSQQISKFSSLSCVPNPSKYQNYADSKPTIRFSTEILLSLIPPKYFS